MPNALPRTLLPRDDLVLLDDECVEVLDLDNDLMMKRRGKGKGVREVTAQRGQELPQHAVSTHRRLVKLVDVGGGVEHPLERVDDLGHHDVAAVAVRRRSRVGVGVRRRSRVGSKGADGHGDPLG